MNYTVTIHKQGKITELQVKGGTNLLQCIRETESGFFAPCGGNGTCGKCRVKVKNDSYVTSCMHSINSNIEITLPGKTEMKILSSQYNLTKTVWPETDAILNLAPVPFGLAVDIGTTSMVFYLVNLTTASVINIKTAINPQSKFGADIISRINYGELNQDGIKTLQTTLTKAINSTLNLFYREQGISNQDLIKISVVGNTTMLHNLMGINALPIAHAPFTPAFTDTKRLKTNELGINIHPEGEIILSPSLSAYVGADILAGLNSLDTQKLGNTYLFVDIGTNGEMVLVHKEKILACATAAGPAFEGANISCGMTAVSGAVSKFSDKGFEVIGNIEPSGICGSGLIDITAFMLKNKLLMQDGNINEDFVISENQTELNITQQDIREIQLAKSAVMSGIKRLLSIAQIKEENLDHVILAGGFGNYINIENAIRIGLLPDINIDKYIQVGNTAGTGAILALKSERFLTETEKLKNKTEYIELSTDSKFSTEFAMNMFFN